MHKQFWFENHPGHLGVDEKIILECVLWKWGGKLWTGFVGLRIGTIGRKRIISTQELY
jgi:hypothetical protein